MVIALKTERDAHDIRALTLISEALAGEAKNLSEKFDRSVSDVLFEALGLLRRAGIQQRYEAGLRAFWANLSPEERKIRASKASRARWDRQKKAEAQQLPLEADANTGS